MLFKFKTAAAVSAAAFSMLTGCAELNSGLAQINDALGSVNSTLSGTPSGGQTGGQRLPDKETATYALRNMQLSKTETGLERMFLLTGEAYNKTSRSISLVISMPIYNKDGFYSHPLIGEVLSIPPHEKTKIHIDGRSQLSKQARVDTSKFEVTVRKY